MSEAEVRNDSSLRSTNYRGLNVTSVTSLYPERVYGFGQVESAIGDTWQAVASDECLERSPDRYSDSCNSQKAMLDEKSADWNERGSSCI
jgi:hypothetical protein